MFLDCSVYDSEGERVCVLITQYSHFTTCPTTDQREHEVSGSSFSLSRSLSERQQLKGGICINQDKVVPSFELSKYF